jgi:hypothetical protein
MLTAPASGSVLDGVAIVVVSALVAVILASALWVYDDARAAANRGVPVTRAVGPLRLDTPAKWFFACLLLWEFVLPLYVGSRSSA